MPMYSQVSAFAYEADSRENDPKYAPSTYGYFVPNYNLRRRDPDVAEMRKNSDMQSHAMHGMYAGAAVAVGSYIIGGNEASQALMHGLIGGGATYAYMRRFGHRLPIPYHERVIDG